MDVLTVDSGKATAFGSHRLWGLACGDKSEHFGLFCIFLLVCGALQGGPGLWSAAPASMSKADTSRL